MIWPDGRYYKGQWYNGRQHGNGVYKTKNGKVHEGIWINGSRQKQ